MGCNTLNRLAALAQLPSTGLVLDAVYGMGARPGLPASVAAFADACREQRVTVVSCDVPSGLDSDGAGSRDDVSFRADRTVSLGAWKIAHVAEPARSRAGRLSLVPIGLALPAPGLVAWEVDVLARDFRNIDPAHAKIILIEGGERILTSFPEHLAMRAVRDLGQLGVEVRCNLRVSKIDGRGVEANGKQIPTATVLWAAGVRGSPLGGKLGGEVDRQGRVVVNPDLSVGSHREVFAVGDMAAFLHQDGKPLPGVSPVAIQQAKKVVENLFADLEGQPRTPFAYFDKGSMATIGRAAAIAHIGRLQIGGFFAWLLWLLVHIFFLITFRNRVAVLFNWAYQYFTYKRGARLITGHRLKAGAESDVAISALPRSALPPEIKGPHG